MASEPSPFIGARACERCHADRFDEQQRSRHARTLVRPNAIAGLVWPQGPVPDRSEPKVVHEIRAMAGGVEAETKVGERAFRAVVLFAMGSGRQGRSFLAREASGVIRELRLSQYPEAPEWDRTMEHPAVPPDPDGYLGRPIQPESYRRCLHCHATDFRAAEDSNRPEGDDHGIGCERCHGPGALHIRAVEAKLPELAIARPRLARPTQVMALCGDCHSAPPSTTPADPGFVRYQVSGLSLSRCYTESTDSFSCVTCHDPHQDAETSAAHYEAICLGCHAPGTEKPASGPTRKGCPVNARADCLNCHMPRVSNAVPRTVFTDHSIRVHRP